MPVAFITRFSPAPVSVVLAEVPEASSAPRNSRMASFGGLFRVKPKKKSADIEMAALAARQPRGSLADVEMAVPEVPEPTLAIPRTLPQARPLRAKAPEGLSPLTLEGIVNFALHPLAERYPAGLDGSSFSESVKTLAGLASAHPWFTEHVQTALDELTAVHIGTRMTDARVIANLLSRIKEISRESAEPLKVAALRHGVAHGAPSPDEWRDAVRQTHNRSVNVAAEMLAAALVIAAFLVAAPVITHTHHGSRTQTLDAGLAGGLLGSTFLCLGYLLARELSSTVRARVESRVRFEDGFLGAELPLQLAEGGELRACVDRVKMQQVTSLCGAAPAEPHSALELAAASRVNLNLVDRTHRFKQITWPGLKALGDSGELSRRPEETLQLVAEMLLDRAMLDDPQLARFAGLASVPTNSTGITAMDVLEQLQDVAGDKLSFARAIANLAPHVNRLKGDERFTALQRLLNPSTAQTLGLIWAIHARAGKLHALTAINCVSIESLEPTQITWVTSALQSLQNSAGLQGTMIPNFRHLQDVLRSRMQTQVQNLPGWIQVLDYIDMLRLTDKNDGSAVDTLCMNLPFHAIPENDREKSLARYLDSVSRLRTESKGALILAAIKGVIPIIPLKHLDCAIHMLDAAIGLECFNARDIVGELADTLRQRSLVETPNPVPAAASDASTADTSSSNVLQPVDLKPTVCLQLHSMVAKSPRSVRKPDRGSDRKAVLLKPDIPLDSYWGVAPRAAEPTASADTRATT